MQTKKIITGHYFIYCQWCKHDGQCELKHHEFMGVESSGEIDKSPYPGHEDLRWHGTAFQQGHPRSACAGRIYVTGSCFYPLACECGTVVDSLTLTSLGGKMCAKFDVNEKGKRRQEIATKILARRGASFENKDLLTDHELDLLERCYPEDPDYEAEMTR